MLVNNVRSQKVNTFSAMLRSLCLAAGMTCVTQVLGYKSLYNLPVYAAEQTSTSVRANSATVT